MTLEETTASVLSAFIWYEEVEPPTNGPPPVSVTSSAPLGVNWAPNGSTPCESLKVPWASEPSELAVKTSTLLAMRSVTISLLPSGVNAAVDAPGSKPLNGKA